MRGTTLEGSLDEHGCADVFQYLGQQRKTGVFRVVSRATDIHLALRDGRVVRVQDHRRDKRRALGAMLVRAGVIPLQTLQAALTEQVGNPRPLGRILVEQHGVPEREVALFLRLQAHETLHAAFFVFSGGYVFTPAESVDEGPELGGPVPWEVVLMDVSQQMQELPMLARDIPSPRSELRATGPIPAPHTPSDEDLDDGDAARSPADVLMYGFPDENDARVHALLQGVARPLEEVMDASRLGAFQTTRAACRLVRAGCVLVERTPDAFHAVTPRSDRDATAPLDVERFREMLRRGGV